MGKNEGWDTAAPLYVPPKPGDQASLPLFSPRDRPGHLIPTHKSTKALGVLGGATKSHTLCFGWRSTSFMGSPAHLRLSRSSGWSFLSSLINKKLKNSLFPGMSGVSYKMFQGMDPTGELYQQVEVILTVMF